jgi:SAM-dependent methyltransferase
VTKHKPKPGLDLDSDVTENEDKAGQRYWEGAWSGAAVPVAVNPRIRGLNNYVNRRIHERLSSVFTGVAPASALLEIGCGASAWLPYFAREFGFRVAGVDYSPEGCGLARAALRRAGVEADVVCTDFFTPPPGLLEAYDLVFSFGVAEHFTDTAGCLRSFLRFLKPGGLMVTIVPNMNGITGALQRLVDRTVYDIHVPLDRSALELAHRGAGLTEVRCEHLLAMNLNVVNAERRRGTIFYRAFVRGRSWISKGVWVLESALAPLPPNPLTSPYLLCVGRKPAR